MGNDIVRKENELWPLRLLLTQKRLYGHAKTALAAQIILVVMIPAILIVVQQAYPEWRVWVATYGLGVAILDIAVIDSLKTGLRRKAALVQELFDCEVLTLPWASLATGRKPDPEDVIAADRSDEQLTALVNWYATAVANVPEFVGRVICQRSNCWWDSKLRRWYRSGILVVAALVQGIVIIVAIVQNKAMADFVLGFLAPTLPIVLWSIREAKAQAEAAERADRLKVFGDDVWARLLTGNLGGEAAQTVSREFQNEIFAHRRQSPLVFDWFYNLFRNRLEQQMGSSVAVMVREAQQAGVT